MTKTQKNIFFCFLILLTFLIFFRLGRHDILSDEGHYAFRSVKFFDYMASLGQTTPVQWFGDRPAWSFFGFHDHPALFFLIQHFSFSLFGDSVVASRLPSALAAIGTALVVYFLAKRLRGINAGIISLGALALNAYFIWMGRIGLIESTFIFFFLLGLLYLVKAQMVKEKYFVHAGLFFALSFLTKYTFLFGLPGIILFMIWKARPMMKGKKFWLGILVFLIFSAPIFIYNTGMYLDRGHFDVQFSDLFKQQHEDWTILSNRVNTSGFNPLAVVQVLVSGLSWPYFAVFILGLFSSLYLAYKDRRQEVFLIGLVLLSFFFFLAVVGPAERWITILSPFAALFIGLGFEKLLPKRIIFFGGAVLVGIFSLFFVLNTNTFYKARGDSFWYAPFRSENYGYNQLDKKIAMILDDKMTTNQLGSLTNSIWYYQINPRALDFSELKQRGSPFNGAIVFDSSTSWFATVWIFERRKFSQRFFMPTAEEFLKINSFPEIHERLRSLMPLEFYFIESGETVKKYAADTQFVESQQIVELFTKEGIVPEIVRDNLGREAFYIYKGVLN
ncbi:MAG: glycosyltransferase family 39 protein [bacterium]|nr:glycosyltransferase family 39 protein [bacterium]